jgi:hypothetical protein
MTVSTRACVMGAIQAGNEEGGVMGKTRTKTGGVDSKHTNLFSYAWMATAP